MASYIGAGTAASGLSGALAPTIHASTASGDFMLLALHINNNVGAAPTVSGWTNTIFFETASGSDRSIAVYYRVYTGSGDAPSVPQQASGAICQVATWRDIDTADPIDVQSSSATFTLGTQDIPVTAVTPTTQNGVVVVVGAKFIDWTSVATLSGDSLTWAEIGEPDDSGAAPCGLVWDYALFSSTPTLTNKTFTVTGGAAEEASGVMLVLNGETVNGPITATLQPLTAAATGHMSATGTVAASLAPATAAATGHMDVSGTAAVSVRPLTAAAAGANAGFVGPIAAVLQPLTAAATGHHPFIGEAASSLQPLTAALSGRMQPKGSAAVSLTSLTAAAAGTVTFFSRPDIVLGAGVAVRSTVRGGGVVRAREILGLYDDSDDTYDSNMYDYDGLAQGGIGLGAGRVVVR